MKDLFICIGLKLIWIIISNLIKPFWNLYQTLAPFETICILISTLSLWQLFIYENNIYYQHSVGELIQQITKSGSIQNGIYHGITDWLYGERILRSNRAIYWSPDGSRLCKSKQFQSIEKNFNNFKFHL